MCLLLTARLVSSSWHALECMQVLAHDKLIPVNAAAHCNVSGVLIMACTGMQVLAHDELVLGNAAMRCSASSVLICETLFNAGVPQMFASLCLSCLSL